MNVLFAALHHAYFRNFESVIRELAARGFPLIDCQQRTPLLAAMGGREIPRRTFLRHVAALVDYPEQPGKWTAQSHVSA